MSSTRIKLGIAVLALATLVVACDEERMDFETETKTVALEGAARAEIGLHMGAGQLKVRGADQEALLEGSFEYNRARLRPDIDYRRFDDKGILHVRHARRNSIPFGRVRNRWDLALSQSVPLDLSIDLGAGESDIDLRGLKLERLEIDMGVGEVKLNLRGPAGRRASGSRSTAGSAAPRSTCRPKSASGSKSTGASARSTRTA